jgi:hypothetical protein
MPQKISSIGMPARLPMNSGLMMLSLMLTKTKPQTITNTPQLCESCITNNPSGSQINPAPTTGIMPARPVNAPNRMASGTPAIR